MEKKPLVLTVTDLLLLEKILKSYTARPDQQDAVVRLYEQITEHLRT